MQASNAPEKIQKPFANTGDKQTIPVASQIGITDGRASYADGFPPLTRTPVVAGGVPPFGTDMNGILNAITAIQQWQSAGGRFVYDSSFASAIGGYPKGATLQKADGSGTWLCTAENNSTNPDTGGAGWRDLTGGRLIGIQVFPATAVYTPTAGTSSVIALVQGAGGGGGGTPVITTSQSAVGGPGNAGGFAASWITSGFSGVTVTVGEKGTSSVAGAGTNGGSSSFGAFLSAPGGKGGTVGAASSAYVIATAPQAPSQSTGGNIINIPEKIGTVGFSTGTNGGIKSLGGCCDLGSSQFNGDSVGYGAGGTSAANAGASGSLVAQAGWSGAPGVVIVLELS